jgi:hypothetical protein
MQGQVIERLVKGVTKLTKRMRRQVVSHASISSPGNNANTKCIFPLKSSAYDPPMYTYTERERK